MSWPLARSLASWTAPNRSSTSTTRRNSCQYALRNASSISRFCRELPLDALDPLPGLLAAVLGAPRAAVALDGRERALGPVAPLALDQLGHREPVHLLGEPAGALLPVARHVQRRGLPEHPLDVALLHRDRRRRGAASPGSGCGAGAGPRPRSGPGSPRSCAAPGPAARARPPTRSGPGARPCRAPCGATSTSERTAPVAADAGEVAAGRVEARAVGHRRLEARHVGLEARGCASCSGTGRRTTRRSGGWWARSLPVDSSSATEP